MRGANFGDWIEYLGGFHEYAMPKSFDRV